MVIDLGADGTAGIGSNQIVESHADGLEAGGADILKGFYQRLVIQSVRCWQGEELGAENGGCEA